MILRTNTDIKVNLFLDRDKFGKSPEVVVNGTTIDDKLSFKTHIENIAEQQKKIARVSMHNKVLSTDKVKTL